MAKSANKLLKRTLQKARIKDSLKNAAVYVFLRPALKNISNIMGYETCKGSMFHNPASPDRFLKKPAKYEFETLDVFQILYVLKI